mmetsp:Transcript_35249/g.44919  ORF Transcript_35249/g.44919 Transcript_35249/m.44919 type:complete len:125 (-) Transcript_35249:373-747(-)
MKKQRIIAVSTIPIASDLYSFNHVWLGRISQIIFLLISEVELSVYLSRHATSNAVECNVCNAINASSTLLEVAVKHCKTIANTGQALYSIVEPNQPAIHWITLQEISIHHHHSGRRNGTGIEAE